MVARKRESKPSGINVGSASLIMVFAVLCLTVFSVLTLISANAEQKLAVKAADAVTAYYDADCRAEEKLAQIKSLADVGALGDVKQYIADAVVSSQGGATVISFSEAIDAAQQLQVSLQIAGGRVSVLSWNSVEVGEWLPDDGLNIWDGD